MSAVEAKQRKAAWMRAYRATPEGKAATKGIGCLKDDIATVRKALLYLEGAQFG